MKHLPWLALLLLLIYPYCTPPLVFTEPQPEGVAALDRFENHYQGTYFCTGDSSLVKVEANCLYKEKSFTFVTSLAALDSMEDTYFEEGKIFMNGEAMPFEILYLDDETLAGNYIHRDTLFQIGPKQVLKFYRGHHILNVKIDAQHWNVWLLSKDQFGNMALSKTILPENLSDLAAITPVTDISEQDLPQYKISPTKAEFRKLLQTRLIFEECDYYEWISPPLNY